MSNGDPNNYFPYPTRGVTYTEPPWVADFSGSTGVGDGSHLYERDRRSDSSEWESSDQSHGGRSSPGEGGGLGNTGYSNQAKDPDPGQGTFGVELEFLVVQCPKAKLNADGRFVTADQHPNDHRWLSKMLSDWEVSHMEEVRRREDIKPYLMDGNGTYCDYLDDDGEDRRNIYSRAKLSRVLRERGLVVIKCPDRAITKKEAHADFVPINDFSESEDSDDQREEAFPNMFRLRHFRSSYEYDELRSLNVNITAAVRKWQRDYEKFHKTNNLKLYRTRNADITRIVRDRVTVRGWPNLTNHRLEHLKAILEERLRARRQKSKQKREDERNHEVDPLHVPVPGLRSQYKAWTVTNDVSVNGAGMTQERYANTNSAAPWSEYYWFGAEVVSPVLPMGDERSRKAVRIACGSLRDALRCHKPMEVSTGLHIHLGHTRGWTLFQAKRFATLWFLIERVIYQLHRIDRDEDRKWCAKMRNGSLLWRALFSKIVHERFENAHVVQETHPPDQTRENEARMGAHVPTYKLSYQERKFVYYIWQYDSITALHEGLGENHHCRTGIKWRIRGEHSSLEGDPREPREPGTIEVRIMQGTLDADHINNWVVVLEHIVRVVRDYSDKEFKDFLLQFLSYRSHERLLSLLQLPKEIQEYWRDPKRRDSGNVFWEYPDQDKVDWADPFMVMGHSATHGTFWD